MMAGCRGWPSAEALWGMRVTSRCSDGWRDVGAFCRVGRGGVLSDTKNVCVCVLFFLQIYNRDFDSVFFCLLVRDAVAF